MTKTTIYHSDQPRDNGNSKYETTGLIERTEYESFVAQLETERKEIIMKCADNPDRNGLADKED